MKFSKKLMSLLLAAVMVMGMTVTAFADNGSPSYSYTNDDYKNIAGQAYNNVSIAAGGGTISTITDSTLLVKAGEQMVVAEKYVAENLKKADGSEAWVTQELLFDVGGVSSGEVTVYLKDQGDFKVADYKGYLAIVYHYNGSTWEKYGKYAKIDDNGAITFSFDSYSPIYVAITNLTADDVAATSIQSANYSPTQTLSSSTSPSTYDVLWMLLAFAALAGVGAYAVRRKMA